MAPKPEDTSRVIEGVAAAIAATLLAAGLIYFVVRVDPNGARFLIPPLLVIGVAQLVYLAPVAVAFSIFGRKRAVIGVVLVGAAVFLLNAACYGLVFFKR